jgi:anti-sigma factor RsiW
MDHPEAMRHAAIEKYLLDELLPAERDEFEQHLFDCQECAADLKTTAAFLDGARREFNREPVARPTPMPNKPRFAFLWRPAIIWPAFAFLLLIITYQNIVVFPRHAGAIATLRRPEVLSPVSLFTGNSAGGTIHPVTVSHAQPILLFIDIPTAEQFSSYSCVLVAPSGAIVWRVPVSAEQAKDRVSIRIPAGNWMSGDYWLFVRGETSRAPKELAELARYRFTVRDTSAL